MTKEELTTRTLRKARTRTLIALGGLVVKSGLLRPLGIEIGADLQKDEEMQRPTAALFWGLLELKKIIDSDDFILELWSLKGQKILSQQ